MKDEILRQILAEQKETNRLLQVIATNSEHASIKSVCGHPLLNKKEEGVTASGEKFSDVNGSAFRLRKTLCGGNIL